MVGAGSAAHERIGQRLGRYELRYLVAQGGMASVYLAQMEGAHEFSRWVAIKVMHPHLVDDEGGFIDMFLDEARLAARIQHPNVCQVLDFGEQDGTYYIVMEYLHGETLSALVKRAWTDGGGLSPVLVAATVADIARGLHAAHELRGRDRELLHVIHRDVSPQNMIVLYDGLAKITDFGIARARGRLSSTQAGMLKGKFAYMSPEQLNGEDVDRRADLWSLGIVLWEASLGRHLFRSRSEGETALKVVQGPIPRPSELVEAFPAHLEEIIMSVLVRDPDARLPSADALATQLEEFTRAQKYEHWGPAEIAEYLANVFPDRLSQREEMLAAELDEFDDGVTVVDLHSSSNLGSGVQVRDTGSIEIDLDDVPNVDQVAPPPRVAAPSVGSPAAAPATAAETAPARRPWWALPAIALGLIAGLTLGALLYLVVSTDEPVDGAVAQLPTVDPGASRSPTEAPVQDPAAAPADPVAQPADPAAAVDPADEPGPVAEAPPPTEAAGTPEPREAPAEPSAPAALAEPASSAEGEVEGEGGTPPEEAAAPTADPPADPPVEADEPSPPSEAADPPDPSPDTSSEPRRPRATPRGEGSLNLLAIPRAEVLFRGRRVGTTPLINYTMPAGTHRLVLVPTDGSPRRTIRVRIRDGERTRESVNLSE